MAKVYDVVDDALIDADKALQYGPDATLTLLSTSDDGYTVVGVLLTGWKTEDRSNPVRGVKWFDVLVRELAFEQVDGATSMRQVMLKVSAVIIGEYRYTVTVEPPRGAVRIWTLVASPTGEWVEVVDE